MSQMMKVISYYRIRHRDFFSFVSCPIYRILRPSILIVRDVRDRCQLELHLVVFLFVLHVFEHVHIDVHNWPANFFDDLLQSLPHDLMFELDSTQQQQKNVAVFFSFVDHTYTSQVKFFQSSKSFRSFTFSIGIHLEKEERKILMKS